MKRRFNLSLVKARQAAARLGTCVRSGQLLKLFLVPFLILSFCFQANLAKSLAETLDSLGAALKQTPASAVASETGPYCEWDGTSTLTFKCGTFTPSDTVKAVALGGYSSQFDRPWYNWRKANVINFDSSFRSAQPSSLKNWFYQMNPTSILGIENLNTSNVTTLQMMIGYGSDFTSALNLSSFNTKNVEDMGGLFQYMGSLKILDLTNWDTSSVTNASGIYQNSPIEEFTISPSYFNKADMLVPEGDFYAYDTVTGQQVDQGQSPISNTRFNSGHPTLFSKIQKAQFYSVTFHANGGTPDSYTQTPPAGSRLSCPSVSYAGHSLEGWYTDPSFSPNTRWEFDVNTLQNNVNLYAKWSQTINLTFNGAGGKWGEQESWVNTVVPASFSKVLLPPVEPTRQGWVFDGYFTEATGGVQVTTDTALPTSATNYYAHWERGPVNLTFNGNGGLFHEGFMDFASTTVAVERETGHIVVPGMEPLRGDYVFTGYFTAPDGGTQITENDPLPLENTNYYAHWKPGQSITLTFDGNGGAWYGKSERKVSAEQVAGATVNLPSSNPTRQDYVFIGYFTDASGGTQITADTPLPASDAVYYAHWQEAQLVTLTYTIDSTSSLFGSLRGTYGQTLKTPYTQDIDALLETPLAVTAVANPGYTFVNWTWQEGTEEKTSTDATFTPLRPDTGYVAATYTAHFAEYKEIYPEQPAAGGKIVMESASVLAAGQTARFHVVPEEGYELDGKPTVTEVVPLLKKNLKAAPQTVEVTEDSPNYFSFTMPNFNVKIEASFKAVQPGPTPDPEPTPAPTPTPLPTPSENPDASGLTPEQQEEIIAGIDDIINGKVTEDQVDPYIKYIYDTYVKPYLAGKLSFKDLPKFLQDYFRKNGILPKTGDMLGASTNTAIATGALAVTALITAAGIAARKRKAFR